MLAGTRQINDHADDKDIFFGQFASRVAIRCDLNLHTRGGSGLDGGPSKPIHTVDDIVKAYNAEKLRLTDDGIALLFRLANVEGLGGMRLCTQIVRVAASLAEQKGTRVDAKLLLAVLRELHQQERAVQKIEKGMEDLRLKVA